MQNFVTRVMIMAAVLMTSSSSYAQRSPQSSETKEHKGLPPICQGEGRFNCASAPVEGKQNDQPAVDFWGRPVAPPATTQKSAPAPRHDISGIWQVDGVDEFGYRGVLGLIGAPAMPSDGNPENEPPYTKEGLEAYHRNKPTIGINAVPAAQANDPVKMCDPPGFPRDDLNRLASVQLLQTALQVVILYPRDKHWRVIWADGREFPKDPDPTWDGYSTGQWADNTTFVVETKGTDERTWLDAVGRPHGDALRVEERFHRMDYDHLELTVTIDDPRMYTKPWVAVDKQALRLLPADFSLSETRCSPSEMANYDSLVSTPIVK